MRRPRQYRDVTVLRGRRDRDIGVTVSTRPRHSKKASRSRLQPWLIQLSWYVMSLALCMWLVDDTLCIISSSSSCLISLHPSSSTLSFTPVNKLQFSYHRRPALNRFYLLGNLSTIETYTYLCNVYFLANTKHLVIYTAVAYDLTVASNWLLDLLNQLLGTFCCHFCSQITVKRRWSSTLAAAVQQTSLCSTSQWYCQSPQHYPALLHRSIKKFSFRKFFTR